MAKASVLGFHGWSLMISSRERGDLYRALYPMPWEMQSPWRYQFHKCPLIDLPKTMANTQSTSRRINFPWASLVLKFTPAAQKLPPCSSERMPTGGLTKGFQQEGKVRDHQLQIVFVGARVTIQ